MKKRHFTFGLILALLLLLIAAFLILNPKCYRCQYTENGESILYLKNGDVHLCYNNFPDDAFRAFVAKTLNLQEGDTVPLSQLQGITELDCSGLGIYDLTGIQLFSNLKILNCSNNRLSQLNPNHLSHSNPYHYGLYGDVDVAIFPRLEILNCSNNKLTDLDLEEITSLQTLICTYNDMSLLSIPYQNLEYLDCSHNHLRTIDDNPSGVNPNKNGANLTKLTFIDFSNNRFKSYYQFLRNLPSSPTVVSDAQSDYPYSLCRHSYPLNNPFKFARCRYCYRAKITNPSTEDIICLVTFPICIISIVCAILYVRRRNKHGKDWKKDDVPIPREQQQPYIN